MAWKVLGAVAVLVGALGACGDVNPSSEEESSGGDAGETGGSAPIAGSGGQAGSSDGGRAGASVAAGTGGTAPLAGSAGEAGEGSTGGTTGGSYGESGAGGTGGLPAVGGTSSAGSGGSDVTGTPCPQIASCAGEPACNAALGASCGTCSLGSYACGTKSGFYSSDGGDFPCAGDPSSLDCVAASEAASQHCSECAGSATGGQGNGGGSSGGVGGGAGVGNAGAGGGGQQDESCTVPLDSCFRCAPICSSQACSVDLYTCGEESTHHIYRATNGGREWRCGHDTSLPDCTAARNDALTQCCGL